MRTGLVALAFLLCQFALQKDVCAQDIASTDETLGLSVDPEPLPSESPWIGPDDFPQEELEAGVSGQTEVSLSVDAGGRTTDCFTTASSGSSVLDSRACELLIERARFRPGLDSTGNPVPSTYSTAVAWINGARSFGPILTHFEMTASIDEDGIPNNCEVIHEFNAPPSLLETYERCRAGEPIANAEQMEASDPDRRQIRLVFMVSFEPVEPATEGQE